MSKSKYNALCLKFKKICEENNIDYKRYDLGFVVYPDGYTTNDKNKQFYLELFSIKNFNDYEIEIFYKHCSTKNLIEYLIEFKNGIINNDFCLNNVNDLRKNKNEIIFKKESDFDMEETIKNGLKDGIFSRYDYLER